MDTPNSPMRKTRSPTTVEEAERITKSIIEAQAKGELPPSIDWGAIEAEELMKMLNSREARKKAESEAAGKK